MKLFSYQNKFLFLNSFFNLLFEFCENFFWQNWRSHYISKLFSFFILSSSSLSSRNERRVNSFQSTLIKLESNLINWRAFYFIKILWQNSVETLCNFSFCCQVELLTVRSVKQSKSVQTLQDGLNGRIPEKMDRVSTK